MQTVQYAIAFPLWWNCGEWTGASISGFFDDIERKISLQVHYQGQFDFHVFFLIKSLKYHALNIKFTDFILCNE